MKKVLKNLGIVVLALLVLAVLLNAPYFYKQVRYYVGKLHASNVQQQSNNNISTNQPQKGEPNQLSIPSLQITAPILYAEENNENKFQELLKDGVVHFPGTAEIGQLGNTYIFGHSSDFAFSNGKFKTVFALLPHIEKGAEIIVSDKDGQVYHYEVIETHVINKDDVSVLSQRDYKEKLLTLQTSYPVGTALKRWIVVAKLKQ